MAIKINFPNDKVIYHTFKEINTGEMFLYGEGLFLKINDFYMVDDIHHEIDCEHNLNDSDEIESDAYNCVNVSTGVFFCLPNWTNVRTVEVEINICKID